MKWQKAEEKALTDQSLFFGFFLRVRRGVHSVSEEG
jgi:hypothetical protein